MNKEDKDRKDIRRAISFKSSGDGSMSPPPVLQKALEFRQGEGVIHHDDKDDENVPNLPNAPPPLMQPVPSGTEQVPGGNLYDNKFSPPVSPKQSRVELIKTDSKEKKKRTPSFNLRRRTRSFKDKYKLPDTLPPVEVEGVLERKHELQSGGKKATIRSWKSFYTALFGQLMAFFKDKEGMYVS